MDNTLSSSSSDELEDIYEPPLAQKTPPTQQSQPTQESTRLIPLNVSGFGARRQPITHPVIASQTQDTLIPTQVEVPNAFASLEAMLATQNSVAQAPAPAPTSARAPMPVRRSPHTGSSGGNSSANKKLRGPNFTKEEVLSLLDTLEEMVPLGSLQWVSVCTKHEHNGWPARSADVLKRKYSSLLKKAYQVPTGDPNIPQEVQRARDVQGAFRAAARAADPSEENGGASSIFHGALAVTANNAQQVASDLEESTSSFAGLDGPNPMTIRILPFPTTASPNSHWIWAV